MQGWLDVVSIGILSLLCFCFGWTFIIVRLVVNFIFGNFIGQRFRADNYKIPALHKALPVVRHLDRHFIKAAF
jgi:hypothetical protein